MIGDMARKANEILPRLYGIPQSFKLRINNGLISEPSDNQRNWNYLDAESTLISIINDGKSISRYGDGELRLTYLQGNTVYEKMSIKKSRMLKSVLKNSNPELIIGFNFKFLESPNWQLLNQTRNQEKEAMSYLNLHQFRDVAVMNRVVEQRELIRYWRIIDSSFPNNLFGEASVFRSEIFVDAYKANRIHDLRDNFCSFIGSKSILCLGPRQAFDNSDNFFNVLKIGRWKCQDLNFIPIDSRTCFDNVQQILEEVSNAKSNYNLILIQAGATATILSCLISTAMKIQTLDIGMANWHRLN